MRGSCTSAHFYLSSSSIFRHKGRFQSSVLSFQGKDCAFQTLTDMFAMLTVLTVLLLYCMYRILTVLTVLLLYCMYRIVGNFQGRKLLRISEKYNFHGEKLLWIARFCRTKGHHAPKFCRENFCEYPQNHKICESFLPQKLPTIRYYAKD